MTNREEELGAYYDFLYRTTPGWVYAPTRDRDVIYPRMLKWPEQRDDLIEHVLKNSAQGIDTFTSPALFKTREGGNKKNNVKGSWVLWTDYDSNAPSAYEGRIPEPSLRVQSSIPGREHHYWGLDTFEESVPVIETRNRSIAYAFSADTSGWDAGQFLRPPGTLNTGYNKADREHAITKRLSDYGDCVPSSAFEVLPSPREVVSREVLEGLRTWNEVLTLNKWTPPLLELFEKPVDKLKDGDRSKAMMAIGYLAAEAGFNDPDLFTLLDRVDKKWGKYADRVKEHRETILIKMVSQIRSKVGYLRGGEFDELERQLFEKEDEPDEKRIKAAYGFESFILAEFKFEWLLTDLITTGGWGICTGDPGVGKTQFILQMARNLALGQDFLKWENPNHAERKVAFLSLEMSAPPLQKFLKSMAAGHSDSELKVLDKNLVIIPLGSALPLSQENGQGFMDAIMQKVMPDILVIDSLQKVLTGEFTSAQDVREFNDYMSKQIRQRYGCAVAAIHHNRKKQSEGPRASDLSDAYGNTFLTADLDFAVNLRTEADATTGILRVDQTKARLSAVKPSFEIIRTKELSYDLYTSSSDSEPRNRPVGGQFEIDFGSGLDF